MNDKPTNRHRDLRSLIRDDAYAASFQSLGQYRTALLACDEPTVQGEPVAWVTADTVDGQAVNGKPRRIWWENNEGVGMPIYAAPQPPFQLPDFATYPDDSDEGASLWSHGFKRGWNSCLGAVAKAMHPTEQHPDVAQLVEALEAVVFFHVEVKPNGVNLMMHYSKMLSKVRGALAAYHKGGDV